MSKPASTPNLSYEKEYVEANFAYLVKTGILPNFLYTKIKYAGESVLHRSVKNCDSKFALGKTHHLELIL